MNFLRNLLFVAMLAATSADAQTQPVAFDALSLTGRLTNKYSPTWTGVDTPANKGALWLAGSQRGTCTAGPCAYAGISLGANSLSNSGGGLVDGFLVNHNAGGGKGGYTGMETILNLNVKTTNTGNTGYYVGHQITAQGAVNDNGVFGATSGHLYGMSAFARLTGAATFWDQLVGAELDIASYSGSSVRDIIGLQVVQLGSLVSGSRSNIALSLNSDAVSGGWQCGLCFGAPQGYNAMAPGSTLVGTWARAGSLNGSVGTVTNGIYLNGYTFTGTAFSSAGFSIDGNGNASTAGLVNSGATVDASKQRVMFTGSSYTVPAGTSWVAGLQTGTVSAQTIMLPTPVDGQLLRISTVGAITALTLTPVSGVVLGVPAGLPANSSIQFGWDAASSQWLRLQ